MSAMQEFDGEVRVALMGFPWPGKRPKARCAECSHKARRAADSERICKWCGASTSRPHGNGCVRECPVCNRRACRNGRTPEGRPLYSARVEAEIKRLASQAAAQVAS